MGNMDRVLKEGIDFYLNEQGFMVLTASYHLANGICCGNGCLNCPFDYINVPEPLRNELLQKRDYANQKNNQ